MVGIVVVDSGATTNNRPNPMAMDNEDLKTQVDLVTKVLNKYEFLNTFTYFFK